MMTRRSTPIRREHSIEPTAVADRPEASCERRDHQLSFELPLTLTSRLGDARQRHGVGLIAILVSAWAAMIARRYEQDQVSIDVRSSTGDLTEAAAKTQLSIGLPGDLAVEELFARVSTLAGAGLNSNLGQWSIEASVAPLRLHLSIDDTQARIFATLHDSSESENTSIERVAACWQTLLESMVATPREHISKLPIVPPDELEQVVRRFNDTSIDFTGEGLIHRLFEQQAERTPDAIALICEGRSLSYAELNGRANQLAGHLRQRGIGPDQLVALCVERGFDMVVGLLGVLKSGGAYVPLDPHYPQDRLRHMLEDAAPRVVLTQENLRQTLPATGAETIALDSDWPAIASQPAHNSDASESTLHSRHLAYVIFTSGSTGRPKGVMVEHASVVNFLNTMRQAPGIAASDCMLAVTTVSFDIAALELYLPLTVGARVVLASRQAAADASCLSALLDECDVSIMQATPATWRMLLSSGWRGRTGLRALCGGEALSAELAARLLGRVGALWNLYGPTETTVWSCARHVVKADERAFAESIGRPIANTSVYVLDLFRQPAPIGVAGEIHIAGRGVARGYLHQPEMTDERFVADPFDTDSQARMYRTGDLGRWRADGTLEYLGRNDHQVKIRGFRIELGEIETALLSHLQVKEAAVVARGDKADEKRLVAYIVPTDDSVSGTALTAESLRSTLKITLPDFMLPSAFVPMQRFPLTPNGKLDRQALPAPDHGALHDRPYEAPIGELEQRLAGLWQELLGVDHIGRRDDFFELGGHSLLIVQLMGRLREVGIVAEGHVVFENATLEALAAHLTDSSFASVEIPANRIPTDASLITPDMLPLVTLETEQLEQIVRSVQGGAANIQDIYPLAPLQEGLFFHHLLTRQTGDAYVRPMLFELASRARLDDFVKALQGVIDRHDILRTAILWEHLPHPVQVVHRRAPLLIEELSLDNATDPAQQLKAGLKPEHLQLDLRQAPLMRLQIAAAPVGERWFALLRTHHLVFDDQSLDVMLEEMFAHVEGRERLLPEPVPYRNHVAHALAYGKRQNDEQFFRDKLGDIHEPTAPFGLTDVHGDGGRIEEARAALDRQLSQRIRSQARRMGVSPATLFHAAWGLVVARTSGRDDAVFGSVLLGRLQGSAGAHRTLGMFINTLPVRLRLNGLSARELVSQTKRELVDLLSHEQASLALAQRSSGVGATGPLFTSLLNYLHGNGSDAERARRASSGIEVLASPEWTNYPVVLSVEDRQDEFMLSAQMDRLVDPRRMLGYMATALASLVEALEIAPQTPAMALSILPTGERLQVLEAFNSTDAPYAREKLAHQLFEEQVLVAPNTVAAICGDEQLTYAELNRKSNRLAHALIDFGLRPDDRVAVYVERGVDIVVALLGVLKAGGAYVPLDVNYPSDRLLYMLADSAPKALITHQRRVGVLPAGELPVILLDGPGELGAFPDSNPEQERLGLQSSHLAYVIYTSGSTGTPKGVMVEHHNMVNLIQWHCAEFDLVAGCHSSCVAAMGFDAAVWEIWPALSVGATLLLAPPQLTGDAEGFLAWWARQPLDVSFLPTPMAELAFGQGIRNESLRTLLIGGDRLRQLPDVQGFTLVNNYGPTESTVVATSGVLHAEDRSLHIGRPIANTKIYILDGYLQPCPIGVAGEIYIGGVGVARGYLNLDELTADRFVTDHLSRNTGGRLYKSGDLARWRGDGSIEFLGRNDDQVKIRGFRVELGEIEAQIGRQPQVREAVVVARDEGNAGKRLVAYLVPKDSTKALAIEELHASLKAVLPDYMVPSAFVIVERLPLTANGKLNRAALPAPDADACISKEYEAPRGEVEQILSSIWQSLLQVERVGRNDNFLELGGHSLLIVQMMERLRRVGLSVDARRVFESPTLADLAAALTHGAGDQIDVPPNLIPLNATAITPEMLTLVSLDQASIDVIVRAVPGGAANIQDIYPLAPLQEGMLFHHLLDEGGDTYVVATLMSLASRERLEQLISALQALINRHDILRTAVLWEELPQPLQVVCRQVELPVDNVPLDRTRDTMAQLADWMKPERQRLDLRRAPLMRLQVAQDVKSSEWYALLQIHHMVDDGASLKVMISEVVASLSGRSHEVPQSMAYRHHVGQALELSRRGAKDAEAFFRLKLRDIEEPTAPFGLLNVHGDGTRIDEARADVAADVAKRIRDQARRLSVSIATIFHAAWGLVIARTSGRDDVVFGSVLLGRLQGSAGAKRIVGMFINTLPLRLCIRDLTAKGLVETTQRELVELLSHEQASLAVAQRCSGIAEAAPLFGSVLNFRHSERDEDSEWSDAAGVSVLKQQYRTNYPVGLAVDDLGHGFTLTALTDRRIDPLRMIGYLQTALSSLLDALEQQPKTRAIALAVLPEDERRQVIESFNQTVRGYPLQALIHEQFELQAAKTPTASAVRCAGETLSFAELNGRANRLARLLQDRGVGPDELVGLCVERSVDMVVGLLGILKAGGAYVPLDPDYPTERLAAMLDDAAPKVVLTQERLKKLLPASNAEIFSLDGDWEHVSGRDTSNLVSRATSQRSDQLAYVIYTSGSTGRPKGVMIEHRNVLSLWQGLESIYRQTPGCQTIAVNASFNFDASVKQLIQVLSGRSLVLVPQEVRSDAALLLDFVDEHRIDAIDCTPSQLKSWIAAGLFRGEGHRLRVVLVGGEPIDAELWRALSDCSGTEFYNVYGPTESTVDTSFARLRGDDTAPHIGRPMENRQVYLLDSHGQPVPVGMVGEIHIGGAGVARGYLNRPELSAERFIADPFSTDEHARVYRSGDLARWREDGVLEYVGRNDQQVKIRGFRMELGEIEAHLLRDPTLADAAVVAREDSPGDKRLVAYVVPNLPRLKTLRDGSAERASAEMIGQWNRVHDETYSAAVVGPSFIGWDSSYTGEPIPLEQMQEWQACTVNRINALRPKRLLEIGCGVGLLLQHLAPECSRYVGMDFSAPAIAQLRRWTQAREELAHVELLHAAATELPEEPAGSFDTIVLNSVVQYFPDIDYLLAVIRGAVRLLGPGGNLFIGDVRHLGLLEMFHSAVQLGKAAATLSVGQLRKRIARSLEQEKELVIDPRFFEALLGHIPGIGAVEVQLKEGRFANELTRYRYDVVIRTGEQTKVLPRYPIVNWETEIGSAAEMLAALSSRRWHAVHLSSIPDARLSRETAALRLIAAADDQQEVSSLRRQLNDLAADAIDPYEFRQWAHEHGYDASLSQNDNGTFDARLLDRSQGVEVSRAAPMPDKSEPRWNTYANDPSERMLTQQLIPQLRESMRERLPDYMVPSAWVVLRQLPLTPNGKLDRRALPTPEGRSKEMGEYVAPQTDLERSLADIWAQVLRIDQVGSNDNFFELGGHSLLATQVVVRIRSSLSVEMPMRLLFERPTIAELAVRVEALREARLLEEIEDGGEDLEALVAEVGAMSENEIQELVRELSRGTQQ